MIFQLSRFELQKVEVEADELRPEAPSEKELSGMELVLRASILKHHLNPRYNEFTAAIQEQYENVKQALVSRKGGVVYE